MPVKLKNRNGVFYAMGTMTLPSGAKLEVRQSTGFTKEQRVYAEQRLAQIIKEKMEEEGRVKAGPEITMADAVRKYEMGTPGLAEGTLYLNKAIIEEFGKKALKDLDKVAVREWAERGGVKNGTVRRRLTQVVAVLNYAKDYGFNVPELRIKRPPEDDHRDRWLDVAERDRFIEGFEGIYHDVVVFLFFTGARIGEALSRKVEHVLPDGVLLESKKGRGRKLKRRVVPLHEGVKAMLDRRMAGLKVGDYVFSQRARKMLSQRAFREHWHKVCEAQGVEDFVPHDARHTFATLLAKTGDVDLQELAQLLGHADLKMVLRYRHLLPRRQVIGINALGVIRTKSAHKIGAVRDEDDGVSNYLALSAA